MKKNILILASALVVLSCGDKKKEKCCESDAKKDSVTTAQTPTPVHPIADSRLLSCDKGYQIIADFAGAGNGIAITVTKDGKQQAPIELYADSTAATGAKYTSKDGKTSFWEAQGSYTYFVNDQAVCECKDQ